MKTILPENIDELSIMINADANEISTFAIKTPLIRLPWLDTKNRTVWAKLECNQLTNSFKVRGAYNAIRKIDPATPVVTASAGNHGLAIAYVAEKLGRKSKIFVPANASELKLRRLINMGAEVIPVGRDLFESTQIAQSVAQEIGGEFISPFSHPDVILGQGSMLTEAMAQHPSGFDEILVPLGGGGLLVGAAAEFKKRNSVGRVTALHPKVFQRKFSDGFDSGLSKPIYPTIADGLAVQHGHEDNTAGLVQKLTDQVEQISEEDMELSVVAMLHNEGLLVEGAGSIGIASLINDPDGKVHKGNVLALISGGNISTSSLMHALAAHTDDEKLGRLLGNRSSQLPLEAVKFKAAAKQLSTSQKTDESSSDNPLWPSIMKFLESDISKFAEDLQRHEEFVVEQGLEYDPKIIQHLEQQVASANDLLKYGQESGSDAWKARDVYRVLVQKYSFLRNSLAWCSASSDQSKKVMFFDPAENSAASVNYDRYGSLLLREREYGLQQALGFDPEQTDLLLTSSGQAAYSVVESFLLREGLPKNPTIVSAPYIYFETLEQVESLKHVNFIRSNSWDITHLANLVDLNKADALYIDPLANLGTLHEVDFRKLARTLECRDWSDRWLVIDGTMVSGGFNPFKLFTMPNHPKILYFESGSKYLQLGLDLQMAGVVVCDREKSATMTRHRRNLGAVMYQSAVTRFPRYDRSLFLQRMGRLTSNAEQMCDALDKYDPENQKIDIAYPRNWKSLGWSHGGGVVSVTMKDAGLNNRHCLDYLIDLLIKECASSNVPLTKGVSFGFSTTRVSAAAAMADNMPPFLRFSIGEEAPGEMGKVCDAVTKSLDKFFDVFSPKHPTSTITAPTQDKKLVA